MVVYYDTIFPVLYKYYNTHSIGNFVVQNNSFSSIENLEVSYFVAKYMDNPTLCPAPRALAGGKQTTIDIYALFSDKVPELTEATVVSGKIIINYTQNNKKKTVEKSHSLRIYDRHVMTWDDDRKVSTYVTYKDPLVIDIAKSIASVVNNSEGVIDTNLGIAMALHESLRAYGITYVKDPTTPFIEFSENKLSVDYIQFP